MNKAEILLNDLKESGLTLGSAESFTAGLFASLFCSVPGASAAFKGAVVCYDRSVKETLLNVNPALIDTFDVVSEPVAAALAENAANVLDCDIAVSFTGNAGPTAEPGKAAVGETYMGIYFRNEFLRTYHVVFQGERNEIRLQAVDYIFEKLHEILKKR